MMHAVDSQTTKDSPHDIGASTIRVHELRLVFAPGKAARTALVLGDPLVTIGREGGGATFALPDRHASREHAAVSGEGGAWTIEDRGSHNGTFVDGMRVERAPLRPGAVVRIGGCVLVYLERDHAIDDDPAAERLLGPSHAMRVVRREARLVAREQTPVLVTGETGCGKELVAAEIHRLSGRAGKLVPVNCAAVAPMLAESELFGHVAGAFTGATRAAEGLFAAAHGGTLFLDEIGELPLDLQPKLLRALAVGEVRSVGAVSAQTYDVRIVAATNRDLDAEVLAGRFRGDLLARLAAWRIHVPPLRDRPDDILPLAKLFLRGNASKFSADAAEALLLHRWPYNVRELEQVIASAMVRGAADARTERTIRAEHLPLPLATPLRGRRPAVTRELADDKRRLAMIDREATPGADDLRFVLAHFEGNVSEVARFFGRTRKQIYRWAGAHDIDLAAARPDEDDA
jgi:transcriptional regulator with GAF, ATPase, and Fis domain